ncbi:MAG: hypothetical protein IPK19_27575 [Chloroflexi bacterium]|nr:hypothetical protein [Chloroflexota bacterium]
MRSIKTHQFAGLRCGVRTDIELLNPEAFGVFDFWYFEGGGTVETTVADKTVYTQKVPDADQPTRVTLRGYGQAIQKVSLLSANEMFLTSFCAGFDR